MVEIVYNPLMWNKEKRMREESRPIKRGEEDKDIKRRDKSLKRLLLISATIWAEKFIACLSGIM